ncbi:hypothetical protein CDD81_6758 [Ophiocordyceps australis]|uniref:Nucleoporin NUP188 n=1 Tax=Ophiocordyceps australis TaxID=1399860 RepID=A0A2C5X9A2_9HYPO|nr:hypothetical protein CDD81_6758 [Ophiocordyceps australis]
MASLSDRNYFPSLEECLSGEQVLLSWRQLCTALSDESGARQTSLTVTRFLSDDYVCSLFKEPSTAFAPPSEATNRDFQTKTAPVNVTSASIAAHVITKVKQDAEWLSKSAQVNLVAALRVVIVELQALPARYLLGPLSFQDAANLQEAAGLQSGRGTFFLSELGASVSLDSDEIMADFDKAENRRRRLFDTLLTERRAFMMAADYLCSLRSYKRLPIIVKAPIEQLVVLSSSQDSPASQISTHLNFVATCMQSIETGFRPLTEVPEQQDEMEVDWLRTLLTEVIHAISIIFQIVDSLRTEFPPSDAINQWFILMEKYSFFSTIQPVHPLISELIIPLTTLSTALSIALLKPTTSLIFLSEDNMLQSEELRDSAFLLKSEVLEQVHTAVINACYGDLDGAMPVIFTWSLVLHGINLAYQGIRERQDSMLQQKAREKFGYLSDGRSPAARRNSAGSIFSLEPSRFDSFLENPTSPKDLQGVEHLASTATAQGRVFDVMSNMAMALGPSAEGSMTPLLSSRIRSTLVEVLKICYPILGYQAETVGSFVSLLTPGKDYWDLESEIALETSQDAVAMVLHDDYLMQSYFEQAVDRYPYETLPFVNQCRALCTADMPPTDDKYDTVLSFLKNTPSLTFVLPEQFQGLDIGQGRDNANSFRLLEDLSLIQMPASWRRKDTDERAFQIPAGTYGRFITDTGRVVMMEYPHSTLALLGRQLEISLVKEGYRDEPSTLTPDELAEVICLLATIFRMHHLKRPKSGNCSSLVRSDDDLMHEVSRHMSDARDVVSIVCEMMEYYMQDDIAADEDSAVTILTSCIKFLDAMLDVQPSRIWSFLVRSELLSSDSRAGKLAKLTGNLDLVSERFNFLVSCLSFFSRLIDTAMSSAIQRRMGNKATSRQKQELNPWAGTAEKVLTRVSLSISQACVDIFESTSTWRFNSETYRLALLGKVVSVLNKMLLYSFGMGDCPASENLVSCLQPAASYIVDCFLSPATGTMRFQPILNSFISTLLSPYSTLYPTRASIIRDQLVSVLDFSTALLRTARYLERSPVMIQTYFFKCSTLLARLVAWSDLTQAHVMRLLQALVMSTASSDAEPPSLLGYLGPHVSKSFIQSLSSLGKPFSLPRESRAIWSFLSSVLRNRQQWMSNCLLTGKTPREAMKQKASQAGVSSRAIFSSALLKLKSLNTLDGVEALAVLDFVSSAQNYWPWTIFTLLRDASHIDALRQYVRDLKPWTQTIKLDAVGTSVNARIAAYVAEILAMQLYHLRHQRSSNPLAQSLESDLDYYLRDGVEVAAYNQSLHNNFAKNFSNKYCGCSLDKFKRTTLAPQELGTNYYYHMDYANDMLKFDYSWLGRKDNGFENEMKLANLNLSLVDAQIALFHAWEFLLVELSSCLPSSQPLLRQMLQVAQQCLNANQVQAGPEAIFHNLVESRANLALIVIQRLVKARLAVKDVNQLLDAVVSSIYAVDEPFSKDSIAHYRTLLKTLFVTLRAYHLSDQKQTPAAEAESPDSLSVNVTQTVLNVLDHVVGKGFRSLVSIIHDKDFQAWPEDLTLLTAILQACLSLSSIEQSQTQVLNIMTTHDIMHAALSLFSWSDQLTHEGDPVYGELSILFLLELSTLPMLAEQLACDGLVSSLMSANLVKYMLRSNLSPYGDTPFAQRCYAVWAKGFLPLMLNMLAALGAGLATEVTYVLNQFSHLLDASVDRFEAPGTNRTKSRSETQYLTLVAASEVHSLALLTRVLAAMRANNNRDIPPVEWDAASMLENVDFWLSGQKLLKERLLPLDAREVEWRSTRVAEGVEGVDNLLEKKVVCQLEAVRDILSDEMESLKD